MLLTTTCHLLLYLLVILFNVFGEWFQSWDAFFRNASNGAAPGQAHAQVPAAGSAMSVMPSSLPSQISQKELQDHQTMQALIRSYQVGLSDMPIVVWFLKSFLVYGHCKPIRMILKDWNGFTAQVSASV